eukprot:12600043-Alexandrium_andersonii.AAC.1
MTCCRLKPCKPSPCQPRVLDFACKYASIARSSATQKTVASRPVCRAQREKNSCSKFPGPIHKVAAGLM